MPRISRGTGHHPCMTTIDSTYAAALAAAVLSFATLVWTVTQEFLRIREARRQGRVSWMREALHQVLVDFVNAAFTVSGRSREARELRVAGSDQPQTQHLFDEVRSARDRMRDALTSIRLLGPAILIEAAEAALSAHDRVIRTAFGLEQHDDGDAAWQSIQLEAKNSKELFLTVARAPLGLEASRSRIRQSGSPPRTLGSPRSREQASEQT